MTGSTRGIARALRAACRSMILAAEAGGVAAQTLAPDIAVTKVVNAPVADLPEGSRGSEGCKVHSVKPMEQLVFEWNAPPMIPTIRVLRTLVYLDFKPLPGNRTELTLRNFGYGDGEEWAKSRAYFARAWPAVMASLEQRFASK